MRKSLVWVLLLGMLCMGLAVQAEAAVPIRVTKTGVPGGDGTEWDKAWSMDTLIASLDAKSDTDVVEIWVASGDYTIPAVKTVNLKRGVKLYGGFAGTETLLTERDWKTNLTVLSGDNQSRSAAVVTGGNGATSADTVLDGFTITGGNRNNGGGGMYNSSSSPTVTNCTFSGNTANSIGGGMYNFSSSPVITNCTFSGNTASGGTGGEGGGMCNYSSSPVITNCTFSGNSASNGGGMNNSSSSSPVITNCTFSGNSASNGGGGMYSNSSSPVVANTIFWGNTANAAFGPDIHQTTANANLKNCVIEPSKIYASGGTVTQADCKTGDPKIIAINSRVPLKTVY